jgi:4'-phosphopantetheinyl transferase
MPFATLICETCLPDLGYGLASWANGGITPPAPNIIQVIGYRLGTLPGWEATLSHTLSPTEQQRADRFRQPADRLRFSTGRGGLRWLLRQRTQQPTTEIQLVDDERGKPAPLNLDGWHVNLSHSGEWVVWAFADSPVGVDVEQPQPGFAYADLIETCFGPAEQRAIGEAGPVGSIAHQTLFYTLWTRKEAILKATGIGLTNALTALSVLDGPQHVPTEAIGSDDDWHVYSFTLPTNVPAAVAYRGKAEIRLFLMSERANE